MQDETTAAALRLASGVCRALDAISGNDEGALTLSQAAKVCGLRAPTSDDDLRELARACVLGNVRTNLDAESGGEWARLRAEAYRALRGQAVAVRELVESGLLCAVCAGKRFEVGHGIRQCRRCGAMTPCRELEEFAPEVER